MSWFNRRPVEERAGEQQPAGYSGAISEAHYLAAVGSGGGGPSMARPYPGQRVAAQTSAAETCARWWSGALSAAEVTGDTYGAVTPAVLAQAGRELIRTGEVVYRIDVAGSRVVLVPAVTAYVSGSPDPATWRYKLTLTGPSDTETVELGRDEVVHFMWAQLPERPWRGISPLALARVAARRAWAAENRLGDVASMSVGGNSSYVLMADDWEGMGEWVEGYKASRSDPTNSGMPGFSDKELKVLNMGEGLAPDAADVDNAREALLSIAAVCGLPPLLVANNAQGGTGLREAYRQYIHASVAPMASGFAAELSAKLDSDIELSFTELRASDVAGRARAYRSLVDAGYPPAMAAEAAGLAEPPATATTPESEPGSGQ